MWLTSAVWFACLALCGWIEIDRFIQAANSPAGVFAWFTDWNSETTLTGAVLLSLPVIVWIFRRRLRQPQQDHGSSCPHDDEVGSIRPVSAARKFTLAITVFAVSLMASASLGLRTIPFAGLTGERSEAFADLPPAYHDEYSYQLQARTFLAGRWTWPGAPVHPELFHQYHVLNEPVTASRYFPWTGAWIAPFLSIGPAIHGHWVAGGIATVFLTLCLLRHLPPGWALVGGCVMAASPGIAVFGNLLLSHHPTLVALAMFLWAIDGYMLSGSRWYAAVAGIGLAAAMLGRPMTAAGFALPFGCWLGWNWLKEIFRNQSPDALQSASTDAAGSSPHVSTAAIALIGVPLLIGMAVLCIQNHEVTGLWFRSPYQLYTDTYTPRHQYGFNNGLKGDLKNGPQVLQAYDDWAANLTPAKAVDNVRNRALASLQWTLSIVPLAFGLLSSLIAAVGGTARRFITLLWMSVLSLHAVHIPYWYDGIMHWHYVFETAPLLIMLATFGWREGCVQLSQLVSRRAAKVWMTMLILSGFASAWIDADWAWGPSKVSLAVSEQSWSRVRFAQFRELIGSPGVQHPALILVDETGADPQLSYIVNPPDLTGDVLVCRLPETPAVIQDLGNAFPRRVMYVFDPQEFTLRELN
jgi:hypothetical protein